MDVAIHVRNFNQSNWIISEESNYYSTMELLFILDAGLTFFDHVYIREAKKFLTSENWKYIFDSVKQVKALFDLNPKV